MNVTLTACDKDSSGGYVKTVEFTDREQFLEIFKEFEEEVPFSRWYLEHECEDEQTEQLVESWIS